MAEGLQVEWTNDESELPQMLARRGHTRVDGITGATSDKRTGSMASSETSWQARAHPCLRVAVERVLRHCHGDRHQAAQAIGVDVETLNAWLLS